MDYKKMFKGGLAVGMAFALTACSGSTASTTTATAASDAAATAAAASTGKAFKLGGSGPTTGDAAVYGLAVQQGAQIAVDEINAAGGKVQFDFNFQDDQADGEAAVNAFNTLIDWGMYIGADSAGLHFAFVTNNIKLAEGGKMFVSGPMGTAGVKTASNFSAGTLLVIVALILVYNLMYSKEGRAIMPSSAVSPIRTL